MTLRAISSFAAVATGLYGRRGEMPDRDVCSHHEALCQRIDGMIQTQEKLNGCMARVDKALGKGEVDFGVLGQRVTTLEKIVWPILMAVILGVVAAVVALVLK